MISFIKVKAHSSNEQNDRADSLAKEGQLDWSLADEAQTISKPENSTRHDKTAKIYGYKIKNINHCLPTGDVGKKYFPLPLLYKKDMMVRN